MPGTLSHSPAKVVRELLILAGFGTDAGQWPIKVNGEPDLPDNCLTVYDVAGRDDGYVAFGERQTWHGIQVRIRSSNPEAGYAKANDIAIYLDTPVIDAQVTIASAVYLVRSFNRTSDVLPLGRDAPNSNRRVFTIDALAMLTMLPTL